MQRDLREGCDELQADMAAHQQRFSGEVTAGSNQVLAAEAFQRIENELVAAKPVAVEAAKPIPTQTTRKEVDGKGYLLSTHATDDVAMRKATPAEQWFLDHALPRVELLLSKVETGPLGQPSWQQRTLAVLAIKARANDLKATGRPELIAQAELADRYYMAELASLLEASSALFGDWKKDAPTRLVVSG